MYSGINSGEITPFSPIRKNPFLSDWTSPDVDNDSIVDVPYPLSRNSEELQFDHYPRILTDVCNLVKGRDICIKEEFTINFTKFTPTITYASWSPSTEDSTNWLAVDSSLVLIGLVMVPIFRIVISYRRIRKGFVAELY